MILDKKCSRKLIEYMPLITHRKLWRHKLDTPMINFCDVITVRWVISSKNSIYFLKHFSTRILNLKSNSSYLWPFSKKSLKNMIILLRVNFLVQLWRIDIMFARSNKPETYGQAFGTCWYKETLLKLYALSDGDGLIPKRRPRV